MLLRCMSPAWSCCYHSDCLLSPDFRAPACLRQRQKLWFPTTTHAGRKSNGHIFCSSGASDVCMERKDAATTHGLSEKVVGVLGGGQLGRMLCQSASQMAIKVMILDPLENCPASAMAFHHVVGSFDNSGMVQEFAKRCGVLTVEIEHVDAATLEKLEQRGIECQPKASTIQIIQDKYLQKLHFSQHAIPMPDFMEIDSLESAIKAGDLFGYPLMIKSKRLAYDGRGNAVAHKKEELSSAVLALGGYDRGLFVEKWASFVKKVTGSSAGSGHHCGGLGCLHTTPYPAPHLGGLAMGNRPFIVKCSYYSGTFSCLVNHLYGL